MIRILRERLRQGQRTIGYPSSEAPSLPARFRGRPGLDASRCRDACSRCVDACPTDALSVLDRSPRLDVGRCLFCGECEAACPGGALSFGPDHRMATRTREDLVTADGTLRLAKALDEHMRRIFGRSLRLRQVSAGGCNACEADVNVLGTVVFDLSRFGIQFVASPRHADGLLVTGALSRNMERAVRETWQAVPDPKLVIAVGACAISGGPYVGHPEVLNGAGSLLPVDLYVPGCPPHPLTILDGLLRLLGQLGAEAHSGARD
jgi:Ni,Fe-hydrogenase III small subunit/NAD-dependent dihydropyrimidine dehydrogenase PreA subunit